MPDVIPDIVLCANWGLGLSALKALLESPVVVRAVFSRFDLSSNDPFLNLVHGYASARDIPVMNADKKICTKSELGNAISRLKPFDFLVVCCFDRILAAEALGAANIAAINLHPSILPAYRGPKPLENAIVRGERITGVTLHELTTEVDGGDIILQEKSLRIEDSDTFGSLFDKQCAIAERTIAKFFQAPLSHLASKHPQDASLASYAPKLHWPIAQSETVAEMRQQYSRNVLQ